MNNVALTKTRASIAPRRVGKNTDNTQTEHNPEKANNAEHSKTKQSWFSQLYNTRPGNEVDLCYNAPELTRISVTE